MKALRSMGVGVAMLAGLASCGSTYELEVRCTQPNATIYLNGRNAGMTPRTVEVPFQGSDKVVVWVVVPDYEPLCEVFSRFDFEREGGKIMRPYEPRSAY